MAIQKYFVEVDTYGYTRWYKDQACTTLHRLDGPAVTHVSGTCTWVVDGQAHREDGPAAIRADGTKEWYQNGQLHRTDGPAIEGTDGSQFWYLNGQLHREDGPASISGNGRQRWYLKGKRIGKADYEKLTASVEEMTMAQVEAALGKRVKIIK